MGGGGLVTFACDGTITLTNTLVVDEDVLLDGAGRDVTLSGGDAVRVFEVRSNVSLTLMNLKVIRGRTNAGGAISNAGGFLVKFD